MVKGLEKFRDTFRNFNDQYVIIGGTACDMAMEEAELEFRATKDLDVVLQIEALNKSFVESFWQFIKEDLGYFIKSMRTESINLKSLGLAQVDLNELLDELGSIYGII